MVHISNNLSSIISSKFYKMYIITLKLHKKQPCDLTWVCVHIDYARPIEGKMLHTLPLVVVDAHSKWLDVAVVTSVHIPYNYTVSLKKLKMFTFVSDSGAVFTSNEFEIIMKN